MFSLCGFNFRVDMTSLILWMVCESIVLDKVKGGPLLAQPSDVTHEVDHDADRLASLYLINWLLMAGRDL